ncbi:hypothetical protein G7046_g6922 [Stylonectria norvegica]|nr:hypothetical protein G7046_g6922 [Stylonectria norvegica]
MSPTEFRAKLEPTSKPRSFMPTAETFVSRCRVSSPNHDTRILTAAQQFFHKDCFKLQTIVLIGAILQVLLCALVPLRWAVVPAAVLLLNSVLITVFQLLTKSPTEFNAATIPGRATAQFPRADGSFGTQPGAAPVVVFNLGVQWNHPLGLFAPGVMEVSERFIAMDKDLASRREELGLLSGSAWRGDDRKSNNTFVMTYYFKDVESIHRFAHEPLHRETWDWINASKHTHIGIFHETFCVPAQAYETVYVNCNPVLLGRAAIRVQEAKGGGKWMNSLVNANVPALKTQYARLSRNERGDEIDFV